MVIIEVCQGCNVKVHLECYGAPKVDDIAFRCDTCTQRANNVSCCLCDGNKEHSDKLIQASGFIVHARSYR
eukprot:UN14765